MISKITNNDSPVAIVTGSGSGIGFAVVEELLQENYIVYACTKSKTINLEKLLNSKIKDIQNRLIIKQFDINNFSFARELVKEIYNQFKRIDVLINSAGIPYGQLFMLTKNEDLNNVFQTNFFSLLSFTQLISRVMGRNKSGSIVNISSSTSFSADKGTLAYGASKAALNYATKVLSKELASQGIRVNAVAPGVTDTYMLKNMNPTAINEQLESSSLKKIANPKEISSLVMFLCSSKSSHITGQIIRVDGGQ